MPETLPPITDADRAKAQSNSTESVKSKDHKQEKVQEKPKKESTHKAKNGNSGILRVVLIVLMILGIVIPGYVVFSNNQGLDSKSESTEILVETSNEEIKQLLESEFVYTGSGITNYYSPSIDASFSVNVSKMTPSESGTSVYLYPIYEDLFETDRPYIEVKVSPSNPYETEKEKYYKSDKFEITDSQDSEGYSSFTITYEQEQFFTPEGEEPSTDSVQRDYYYKKLEDQDVYVYAVVTSKNSKPLSDDYTSEVQTVITSFVYKPENAPTEATANVPEISANISFDRKMWELTSQYDTYVSFTLHEDNYKAPYITVNFRGSQLYGSDTKDTVIEAQIQSDMDYNKEKEGYKLIKDPADITVGEAELPAKTYQYKYASSKYTDIYVTAYYGLTPSEDSYFEIMTRVFVDKDSEFTKDYQKEEVDKMVNGLSFDQETQKEAASDLVLGENTISVEEPALIGKLGTVHIANTTCATFTINDPIGLPGISGQSEKYCSASTGTGFFVTPDGYIMTNAHVASGNPYNSAFNMFMSTDGAIFQAVLKEIARQILAENPYALQTTSEIQQLVYYTQGYIIKLIGEEKISATNVEYSNYMELDEPFQFDIETMQIRNPENYVKLEVVKANEINSMLEHYGELLKNGESLEDNPFQYNIADLAVVKAPAPENGAEYPAIPLGDEATLLEGSDILAIGYPGIANDQTMFSSASSTTATITRGTISALRSNPTDTYKLIQTDAAINHGNSGGPMVGSNSKVVAVSTYLISGGQESDNYGAGISVDEVKNFLSDASVSPKQSTVVDYILEGIDNMQKDYYSLAIDNFAEAVGVYPGSEDIVKPLRLLAQEKIDAGEDNSPIFTLGSLYIHPSDMPVVIAGLGGTLLALIILLVVVIFKKPKKNVPTGPQQPLQQGPQMQSTTQPGQLMQQAAAAPQQPLEPKSNFEPSLSQIEKSSPQAMASTTPSTNQTVGETTTPQIAVQPVQTMPQQPQQANTPVQTTVTPQKQEPVHTKIPGMEISTSPTPAAAIQPQQAESPAAAMQSASPAPITSVDPSVQVKSPVVNQPLGNSQPTMIQPQAPASPTNSTQPSSPTP